MRKGAHGIERRSQRLIREAKRNREALQGKMALSATYEQMGLDIPDELVRRIQRERNYYKVRSHHDDEDITTRSR